MPGKSIPYGLWLRAFASGWISVSGWDTLMFYSLLTLFVMIIILLLIHWNKEIFKKGDRNLFAFFHGRSQILRQWIEN